MDETDLNTSEKSLERKLQREKSAREQAERQLEDYSLQIYYANQNLKQSLERTERSARELKFLNDMSSEVSSDSHLAQITDKAVELITEFLHSPCGFQFIRNATDVQILNVHGDGTAADYIARKEVAALLSETLELNTEEDHNKWSTQFMSFDVSTDESLLLYTNISASREQSSWLGFFYDGQNIDSENLAVLETARAHLQTGIRRRFNDERVLQHNLKLQDTIENLEATKKQLLQSEKMASLGQLAAGIAHEINNPIGYVQSNQHIMRDYLNDFTRYHSALSELIKSGTLDQQQFEDLKSQYNIEFLLSDTRDIIASNLDGAQRISAIVQELRTFSHGGENKTFEPTSIPETIDSALKIVWNSLKYQHKVTTAYGDDLPMISGNKGQLQQVFVNLFVNAAQAMPEGGELSISADRNDQQLIIEIRDNGLGMNKETIDKLFTPFYTTKPVGEGTGLGLSVSYAILEAHNAEVSVISELGKGSCFVLTFPLN